METHDKKREAFSAEVGKKEKMKLKALRKKKGSVWAGLGLFGVVGWTIVVPTIIGVVAGRWLDKSYPEFFSWTMSLMMAGLLIGCAAATYWIKKEYREMHQNHSEHEGNHQ